MCLECYENLNQSFEFKKKLAESHMKIGPIDSGEVGAGTSYGVPKLAHRTILELMMMMTYYSIYAIRGPSTTTISNFSEL